MRDHDSTVKNLREAAKGLLFDAMPYRASVMRDAADAIEELLARDVVPTDFHERCLQLEIRKRIELEKQMPHWISVEDELPEENKQIISYLAYKGMAVLQYENKHFYMQGAFQPLPKEAVTHWMPLPEPPEEKDDEH